VSRGWQGATFTDAVLAPAHRRTLAVTFDDAFDSVRTLAAPILAELGLPGTVFVATDWPGRALQWPEVAGWRDTPHADELQAMSWDALRALAASGWEIGAHTCSHPHLSRLAFDAIVAELKQSRAICEQQLGIACQSLAHPFGDTDDRVRAAAAAAGYAAAAGLSAAAFVTRDRFNWPRVGVWHDEPDWRFNVKVSPATSYLRRWRVASALDRARKRVYCTGPRTRSISAGGSSNLSSAADASAGAAEGPYRRISGPTARPAAPIPLAELQPRELAAWRDLAARVVEPNPFFEPECVLPAARHLGASEVGLLVVQDGAGEWLGCMPVSPWLRSGRARVPVLSGWRHLYAFLGTPLVARSEVEVATERLLESLLRASRLGIVALPQLGDDGPVTAGLLAVLAKGGGRPAHHRSFERAVMRRATLADGVEALLSSRHRRDLRRLERRLGEQLGSPLEVRDESQRAAAVDGFMVLEAAGWKGDRGTAIHSRAAHREFFCELCDGFRASGRLQLLALGNSEQTVSYKCNLLTEDAVFCVKVAFDESLGHYRPGLQLELRMLKLFRDHMQQTWMDSCADPDSELFRRLWPDRRPIGSYVFSASHGVGSLIKWGATRLETRATAAGA
jgi:peptidoglycan/xylan/chitin deacetylase (PgdA/CDA1 family)/CelD/BcsL family acetyltransferase involved in cellulose biosynthesis